ncbi:MAG: MarR family transcriptional regulator [Nocardioidaceae bacterium]|nr:MarR family transcriptional regulator [Nocardioidaceae bacterium]MCL2614452.1 MarR family transcriptional regulator [Nocardioidaceae bacterium]
MSARDVRIAEIWSALAGLVLQEDRRRRVSDELGISFYRAKVLRRLLAGPTSMRDLALRLTTDKANLSGAVDDLEGLGLVERSVDPDDRRVRRLALTPAGRKVARRAEQIMSEPPAGFAGLSERDLAQLERILAKLSP